MPKKVSCIVLAVAVTAPGPALAQQALPNIDIGAAPLRAPRHVAQKPEAPAPHPAPARAAAAPTRRAPARPAPPPVAAAPAPQITTLPAAAHVLDAKELNATRQFNLGSALERAAPGVSVNGTTGNPFQPEVDFRGFVASPVVGTPQGLAVYQNGVRVNESFGDTVNWDLIPAIAIDRVAIVTGNPLFGLNAIGGAVTIDMKNGFSYQGFEADARGGSFGRRQGAAQYGVQSGAYAGYVAFEAAGDNGYRNFGGSQVRRFFGDVGWRGEAAEVHFTLGLAQNRFGVAGPAPAELANIDTRSVYTTPQTTKNTLAQYGLNAAFTPAPNWKILADLHYRAFDQAHVDGNTTDFATAGGATLVNGNGDPTNIPDLFGDQLALGVIDRTYTRSRSFGGTAQIENTDKILDRGNKLIVGASYDHGWSGFTANEELGVVNPFNLVVGGTGVFIEEQQSGVASVHINAANSYLGVYALDALDVTDRLTVTTGARFNHAAITLFDLKGVDLNGASTYSRINPMAGASYRITPELAVYASYSEANRAPTPLELGCADATRPCVIDNFLVADPPLKQVVSHTIESGFRGDMASPLAYLPGRVEWSAGVYRTLNRDDIINVPSQIAGRGYFTNAGDTQRQGIETSLRYRDERLSGFLNYTLTDATFRTPLSLGSPNNPLALALGGATILVGPGSHLPSVSRHRLKAGFDYALLPEWKVGADVVFASGGYVRGDETNYFGTLPSYATVNLRSSYQLMKNVELYGLIENAGSTRVRNFATFFDTAALPFIAFNDPRQVSVSPPMGLFAGVKVTY
jgi:iron complex outermembrane recepter protein